MTIPKPSAGELADRIEKSQPIMLIGGAECPDVGLHPADWQLIVAALRAPPASGADSGVREALKHILEMPASCVTDEEVIENIKRREVAKAALASSGVRCGKLTEQDHADLDRWRAALRAPPASGADSGVREALVPFIHAMAGVPISYADGRTFANVINDVRAKGTMTTITFGQMRRLIAALANSGNVGALDPVTVEACAKIVDDYGDGFVKSSYTHIASKDISERIRALIGQPALASNAQEVASEVRGNAFVEAMKRFPTGSPDNKDEQIQSSKRQAFIDGYTLASPPSVRPVEREKLARTIYKSRSRLNDEAVFEHFAIYTHDPDGLGDMRMSVFMAYRDADAILLASSAEHPEGGKD
jgi:hypothetical protein